MILAKDDLGDLVVLDAEAVRARLTYEAAIPVVREAMIALSDGRVRQQLPIAEFAPLATAAATD